MEDIKPAKLTKTLVLQYMNRAVDEVGKDHTITDRDNCLYFDPDDTSKPLCLIGYVLHYHGYRFEDLSSNMGSYSPIRMNHRRCDMLLLEMTDSARGILCEAQIRQDNGRPWAEVVCNVTNEFEGYED